ncbi:MAG: hypothetical protein MUP17_05260 [candidate division Zixibacteria bacterium]|nr:hypothetical protein [candidate division Zixibacteria bacterium]
MQQYPESAKVIKEENRNFLDKVRPWIELATFFIAMGVLLVMVWNSLQTQESIKLTRDSVNKLDTGFALTREANNVMSGQLDVMRKDYALAESTFMVERNKSVAEIKDMLEKGKPKVIISCTKVDSSSSGLTAYIDFTNEGASDAEKVEISVIIKKAQIPKDSTVYPGSLPEISKHHGVNLSFVAQSYRGEILIRAKVKYRWSAYDLVYESEKFFRYSFENEDKAYHIRLMDDNEAMKRW